MKSKLRLLARNCHNQHPRVLYELIECSSTGKGGGSEWWGYSLTFERGQKLKHLWTWTQNLQFEIALSRLRTQSLWDTVKRQLRSKARAKRQL